MVIDMSRYSSFLRNPEAYRLHYVKNLVPRVQAYGLARGTAFHTIVEYSHKGANRAEIDIRLAEIIHDPKAIRVAWAMWNEWTRKFGIQASISPIRKIAAELEFKFALPKSRHEIAGRIDEILAVNTRLMCGEIKTANDRSKFEQIQHDWRYNPQADFEMLGAQLSGYKVEGVLVRVVRETTPVQIWSFDVLRTPEQLDVAMLNIHQVCETIEMYMSTYGADVPWPHVPYSYPCSMPGRCEYAGLCGRTTKELTQEALSEFVPRTEHLACLSK